MPPHFSSPGTAPLRCLCAPAPAGLRSTQQFFPVFQGRGAFTDSLDGAGLAASPALQDFLDHIQHRLGRRTAAAQAGEGKGKEESKGTPFFRGFAPYRHAGLAQFIFMQEPRTSPVSRYS